MKFTQTALAGCYIVDIQQLGDDRGFFARAWCAREFEAHGLSGAIRQANLSYNTSRGTLRGMHYQAMPHGEAKAVRCVRGAIYDVVVDLRPDSRTYRQWIAVELTAENRRMLYVPERFAHGFQTLQHETEVYYLVSEFYTPEAERGVRFNDPSFGIEWPLEVSAISDKDANWPDFGS